MSFSRHTSRIYCDIDDINGAINALGHEVMEGDPDFGEYYMGALMTLTLIRNHEDIRDQSVFMDMFNNQLKHAREENA